MSQMNSNCKLCFLVLVLLVITGSSTFCQIPSFTKITGEPRIYSPNLLNWPRDFDQKIPDLTEPTSNRIYDLHMQVNDCDAYDLILSTSGNYHMALTEFWYEHFLPKYEIDNWFFSTSPPVGVEQSINSELSFGNVALLCQPHLIVGPIGIMDSLARADLMEGQPMPLFTNHGNVLLVKKGNPKNIQTIWDLVREEVVVATSNPYTEPGSFGNYAQSIYQMALAEKGKAAAIELFDSIFGKDSQKWVVGERIHHREVPHLLYANQADVSIVFYHLARYFVKCFPDEFEMVHLGGTVENPAPVKGNKVGKLFIARVKTELNKDQETLRESFLSEIESGSFNQILEKHFLAPMH